MRSFDMIQDRVWSSDNDQETAKEERKEIRFCYIFYDFIDTRNTSYLRALLSLFECCRTRKI